MSEPCAICGEPLDEDDELDPHGHFSEEPVEDSVDDDKVPPHMSGPGYGGAPVELVERVAFATGKTISQVTSDDIDAYIANE